MKKIILSIISISLIFSSINCTLAKEDGLIEDLLNLNYGPIILDLSLEKLETFNFKDKNLNKIYKNLVTYDLLIRDEIINSYKKEEFNYYTTNGIIRNYKTFVNYTNDFFYFLKQIDKNPYLKYDFYFQNGLLKTYKNSQIYYKKVKSLVNQKM